MEIDLKTMSETNSMRTLTCECVPFENDDRDRATIPKREQKMEEK